ncbi:MAG: twin-arginine translocation signal domain-containing protein [bacterium]|nr:twin-arginine translocation signal domain-containing protein [bacterium]
MVDIGTLEKGADVVANLGKPNQPQFSRRNFLKGSAAVTALTIVGASTVGCEKPSMQPPLQYLRRDGEKLFLTDKPEPVEVTYSTNNESSTDPAVRRTKITLRIGKPGLGGKDLPVPETALPPYAVRVFGDPYQGSFGSETVFDSSGKERKGGYWFMISDKDGKPTDLWGNVLKGNEDRFFVAANFATVKGPATNPQLVVNK